MNNFYNHPGFYVSAWICVVVSPLAGMYMTYLFVFRNFERLPIWKLFIVLGILLWGIIASYIYIKKYNHLNNH